jgi:putative ATP-grasp target RiPP
MDTIRRRPWGLTRMTDRFPGAPSFYASVVLDPATQLAVFYDGAGREIDMGKHGTNRAKGSGTMSGGGGDGDGPPKPQTSDDSTTDYVPD